MNGSQFVAAEENGKTVGNRKISTVIALFSIAQIVTWGTTFHLPATASNQLASNLNITRSEVFFGPAVMLAVGAIAAPCALFLVKGIGLSRSLIVGNLAVAGGLVVLANSYGLLSYVIAWVMIGAAFPLAFGQVTTATLAEVAQRDPRAAIGRLMVWTALSGTLFWPLTGLLLSSVTWRETCVIFAVANCVISVPANLLALKGWKAPGGAWKVNSGFDSAASARKGRVNTIAIVLSLSVTAAMFVGNGFILQSVEIMHISKFSLASAIGVGSLFGMAQVCARFFEVVAARNVSTLQYGLIAVSAQLVAAIALFVLQSNPIAAVIFILFSGFGMGAVSVLRYTAPVFFFGTNNLQFILGWMALPQNLAVAVAPYIFSFLISNYGLTAAAIVAVPILCISLTLMLYLEAWIRRGALLPSP